MIFRHLLRHTHVECSGGYQMYPEVDTTKKTFITQVLVQPRSNTPWFNLMHIYIVLL